MLPDFRCQVCTQPMERVDAYAWMCVKCRINEYWFEESEEQIATLLQREWDAASRSLDDDVA